MELLLEAFAGVALFGIGGLVFALVQHLNTMRVSGTENLSSSFADRYRPMMRLLSDDDFGFLEAGGCAASRIRHIKAERRQLFRGYLRCLVKDYGRLLNGLRVQMLQSASDRPDLAMALAKNRMLFTANLLKLEVRLALHTVGVGRIDVSGLVQALEAMRGQAAMLSAASAA